MSWGYRITILYLGFVGIILTLVTISSRNKEELVSKDYYAQELAYQDRLTAISNEKNLSTSIQHEVSPAGITLTFAGEAVEGKIFFFCPANSKKDKSFKMEMVHGTQFIPASALEKGIYKMQLTWKSAKKDFYKEEFITIR